MTNEFESLDVEEGEAVPTTQTSSSSGEEKIIAGSAGTVFDWNQLPDGTKAPPRENLNGKEVFIKSAEIIIPPKNKPFMKSKDGTKLYKMCTFAIHYDWKGQTEFISGLRVFQKDDGVGFPTCTRDRKNQASALMGKYADFKKKDIAEVTLKEFFAYLNSNCKVLIKTEEVKNPTTGEKILKNMIDKFL